DGLWELASCKGRLWLTNEPHLRLEQQRISRWRQRRLDAFERRRSDSRAFLPQIVDTAEEAKSFRVAGPALPEWFGVPDGVPTALTPPRRGYSLAYPFAIAAAAALPFAWAGLALVKRRRTKQSRAKRLCISCGYDLRATPDRCPECGAVPVGAKAAT